MNFSEPHSRIEGCNEQGYVLITEKLGELNIPGETEPIPIWATFDSSRQAATPYLGMWRIAFLECSLVQLSEDEFQLTDPSGWKRFFRRVGKGSDLLEGGGWKGQLASERATLWADCGWRIDLYRGKIIRLKTPHDQTISYNYTNGRISSVVCGTKTLIAIDPADGLDHTLGMTFDGKRCSIVKSDQPRVQRVAGVNVIAGSDASFTQLTSSDHQTRSFAYSVDDQTRPVLTITDAAKNETVVSWNPETRRITRYGKWKYNITLGESVLANAAIERTNSEGQKEFWFYDGLAGKETLQIGGSEEKKTWFVSGQLAGKIRNIDSLNKSGQTFYRASYDEKGNLIREDYDGFISILHESTKSHFKINNQ